MNDLISAAAFIRRRVPKLRKLPVGRKTARNIYGIVCAHAALKSMCIVKVGDKIEAVGLAHNGGIVLHVEHVASRSLEGMRNLLRFVMYRWPQCQFIKFCRENGKYNTYPMNKFLMKAGVI